MNLLGQQSVTSKFPRASRDPLKALMFLKPFLMGSAVKPTSQTPGTGINKILPSFSFWRTVALHVMLVSAVQ